MATFTGTGSSNTNYTGTLTVTEQSYSVQDNSSIVSYSLQLKGTNGSYFQGKNLTTTVSINGTTVQSRSESVTMPNPSGGTSTYTVCSGTVTVPHDNDGTKTITVWATMQTASQSNLPGNIRMPGNLNGTLALTNIPRPSTLTIPTLTIGSSATLQITASSNSFTHKIEYAFVDTAGTIATLNAGVSSYSWTVPTTFYAKLPNSTSGSITITLTTYSNGNAIGTNVYSSTVYVGSSIKPTAPTVTLTQQGSNAWINAQNPAIYVAGYSSVKIQSSATAGTGAAISGYTISGSFSSNQNPYTSGILNDGTKQITVTAKDTRGRTNSTTTSITVLVYSNPRITSLYAVRGTYSGGVWTTNSLGDHICVTAVPEVSLSAQGNTPTVTVRIGYTSPNASSGNDYYFTSTSAANEYTVTASVTDSIGNISTRTLSVPSIEVPLNINVDLPGVGVGMIAQEPRVLDISPSWGLRATVMTDQWWSDSNKYGIDMSNSDIINANGIWWKDTSASPDEGLHFYRDGTNWDTIYANAGVPYFMPNHTATTSSATSYRMLTVQDAPDYVVQSYKSGVWRCRVWASGVKECWTTSSVTISGWTQYGSVYMSNQYEQTSYPTDFFASGTRPVVTISVSAGFDLIGVDQYWNDTNYHLHTPRMYPLRYNNQQTGTAYLSIHAFSEPA